MSNTADVTPYDSDQGTVANTNRVASPAFAPNDAELAAMARYDETRRQDRLTMARVRLHLSNPAQVLATAYALGFAAVDGLSPQHCDLNRPVNLRNAQGEHIALQRIDGKLDLASQSSDKVIHKLVHRCVLDNAKRHLENFGGGRVTVRQLSNGEVELQAIEAKTRQDGTATVTARIDTAGVAQLDIENVRGGRCEDVLKGFAAAVGGTARNKKLKPAYFQNPNTPGEPARVKLKG